MAEQSEQACVWAFAPEYRENFGLLPPSQQREALKRLTTRRRNPLTEVQCAEPSAEAEACLEAVNAAYLSKKARSKAASATKRMIQKAHPDNVAAEPEAEPEDEVEVVSMGQAPYPDGPGRSAVAALSVEPAEIVAESAPEPSPVPRSKPIPIPAPAKPVAVARAPAATPASLPAPVGKPAQKSGLGAMLKR